MRGGNRTACGAEEHLLQLPHSYDDGQCELTKYKIVYRHTAPVDHPRTLISLSIPSVCGGMILCDLVS